MYSLEVTKDLKRLFKKIGKKDPIQAKAIERKIEQILLNPFQFKPLRAPLQGKRRVRIMKSFVLVYEIDEKSETVVLKAYKHHDRVYK